MDFEFNEAQLLLKQTVRDFAQKEIAPVVPELEREERFPLELVRSLGQQGFLAPTISQEYGGGGMGMVFSSIILEELGRVSPLMVSCCISHSTMCSDTLFRHGNEEQRKKYLSALCSGEKIGALAITEPNAGSDAMGMQTKAEREKSDYVLNGTKTFITNAGVADLVLLYAKTDPSKGPKGISAFLIEKGFPGFSVVREIDKLGLRGSACVELSLEDCRVPEDNLLGQEGAGIAILMSGLNRERISCAAGLTGEAQGAFELALDYAKKREQFGKAIINFQLIQARLADMGMAIEASRLLAYRAASLSDEGKEGVTLAASYAKLFASETAVKVAWDACHIFGGYGYTKEFPVERFMRDIGIAEVGAGSSEVQRVIIARELSQLPLSFT